MSRMAAAYVYAPVVCARSSPSLTTTKAPVRAVPPRLHLRDRSVLAAELRRFSAAVYHDPHIIPSAEDLDRARRADLRVAIERYHGGFVSLRNSLSSTNSINVAAPVYSQRTPYMSLTVLRAKLVAFSVARAAQLDERHTALAARFLPRLIDLTAARRTDLLRSIKAHGGLKAVAEKTGLQLHARAARRYESNFHGLSEELRAFVKESGKFPSMKQLRDAGRLDLVRAVRAHGGAKTVSARMGLRLQRGKRKSSCNELRDELVRISGVHNCIASNRMLIDAGRMDLVREIATRGGAEQVAFQLGLKIDDGGGTVFDEQFFQLEICESQVALEHNESRNCEYEVRGGGGGALLPKDGGRRRQAHHFGSFEMLKNELLCFIFDDGIAGVMPTAAQLIAAGRRDLVRAMQLHGGQKVVAAKLGLLRQSMGKKQILERIGVN